MEIRILKPGDVIPPMTHTMSIPYSVLVEGEARHLRKMNNEPEQEG